ncbi:MAG TPA: hypothetical protein VGX03_22735 [Candidatus Binatia bacterium]|jgi:hypothetical protein|nr:hypothetical protein [Candidatus Binatia bacterium]
MIPATADDLGIKRRMLYWLAQHERVRTEKVSTGSGEYLTISHEERERVRREREEKQLRKVLIQARAMKTGSTIISARRWVERQERNELGLKEMGEMIGREWLEKAVHSLSQNSQA